MLASYAVEILPALEDVFREQTIEGSDMLHITDGESVAGTLREFYDTCGQFRAENPASVAS
jgi:hypothetical protein